MMHGGNKVRAHLKDEYGQGEDGCSDERTSQCPRLALTTLRVLIASIRRFGGQATGLVTRLFDSGFKICRGDAPCKMAHPRALGRQIYSGFEHARNFYERFLYPAHTRCAGHVLDRQLDGLFANGVASALNGVDSRLRIGYAGESNVGAFGGEIDHGRLHSGDRFQRSLDTADT